jgi:hypothetical protein
MEFTPDAVDIFTSKLASNIKYHICVGYVIGDGLYYMRKFGMLYPKVKDEPQPVERIVEAVHRTYDVIPVSAEITIPVFAYTLGAACEYDDDGEPIGYWPQIGRLVLTSTDKLLLPGGKLPQAYEHLRPMQLGW